MRALDISMPCSTRWWPRRPTFKMWSAHAIDAAPAQMDAFFLVDLFVNFNTGFVTATARCVPRSEESSDRFPIDFVQYHQYWTTIRWAARHDRCSVLFND